MLEILVPDLMNGDSRMTRALWRAQLNKAMSLKGGNLKDAKFLDYIMHFLSFFWKVFKQVVKDFHFFPKANIILHFQDYFCNYSTNDSVGRMGELFLLFNLYWNYYYTSW